MASSRSPAVDPLLNAPEFLHLARQRQQGAAAWAIATTSTGPRTRYAPATTASSTRSAASAGPSADAARERGEGDDHSASPHRGRPPLDGKSQERCFELCACSRAPHNAQLSAIRRARADA